MRDRKFRLKTGGSGSKIGLFLAFGLIIGASVISAILMIAEKDLSHIGLVLFWGIGGCLVLSFAIFVLEEKMSPFSLTLSRRIRAGIRVIVP